MVYGLSAFIIECGVKYWILIWITELSKLILIWHDRIAQPLCLGMLIQYFRADSTMPTWQAYLYATGVVLSSALYTIIIHPFYFGTQHIGMKLRIASCSLIYKKVLESTWKHRWLAFTKAVLPPFSSLECFVESKGSGTNNKWPNSESTVKWRQPIRFLSRLPPLLLGGSCSSNHQYGNPLRADWTIVFPGALRPTSFCTFTRSSNVSLMKFIKQFDRLNKLSTLKWRTLLKFPTVCFIGWMGKMFSRLRMSTALRTDERIRTMNEILSGMRVIKMYTWENSFAKLVDYCRR